MIRLDKGLIPLPSVSICVLGVFCGSITCLLPAQDCQFVDASRGPAGQGGPVAMAAAGSNRLTGGSPMEKPGTWRPRQTDKPLLLPTQRAT
jgi:hypothetical protein